MQDYNPKVFVVSWSPNGIRLCESLSQEIIKSHREGISTWFNCSIADFMPYLVEKIQDVNPDILVFGFTQSAKPGDYFFSDLMRNQLPDFFYHEIGKSKFMGFGGYLSGRGIRIAVYAHKNYLPEVFRTSKNKYDITFESYSCATLAGTGGIAAYLQTTAGTLCFICVSLPDETQTLIEARRFDDYSIRQRYVDKISKCLNAIVTKLYVRHKVYPDAVVLFGNFGYKIIFERKVPASRAIQFMASIENPDEWKEIRSGDELYREIMANKVGYFFSEGVDDKGPQFLPNCPMIVGRPNLCQTQEIRNRFAECFEIETTQSVAPSWCERILYSGKFKALEYSRFDVGETMRNSTHAGVYSVLQFS
jgi:hypothetical protein